MSHFSVLVIGQNLGEQLRPYHEFECTGIDDEYVQEIDETTELRERYESATRRRLRDPEGKLLDPWGDEFYRDPTPEELEKIGPLAGTGGNGSMAWSSRDWGDGLGYRTKIREVPPEMEEVEVPVRDMMTFREYVKEETGREEVVAYRRPLYRSPLLWALVGAVAMALLFGGIGYPIYIGAVVGWVCAGLVAYLGLRGEGSKDLPEVGTYGWTEVTDLGPEGEVARSVDRTNPNKRWDYWTVGGRWKGFLLTDEGPANYALAGDVRFDLMREEAAAKAMERWQRAHEIIEGREWERWAALIEGKKGEEIQEARERYRAQPVVQDFNQDKELSWDGPDEFAAPLEEYVAAARRDAVVTFAVVKDGQWYERGKMGWWACVSDEVSRDEWAEKFSELIDGLDPATPLTVVDCHI